MSALEVVSRIETLQLEAAVLIAVRYYYKGIQIHRHTQGCTYSTPSSNKPLAGAQ